MVENSFFREIDEDIRNERIRKLWQRYGKYVIGLAIVIIVGIIGYKGLEYRWDRQAQAQGDAFLNAFTLSDESIEAKEKIEEVQQAIENAEQEIERIKNEQQQKTTDADNQRARARSQLQQTRSQQQQLAREAQESGAPLLSPFLLTPDNVTTQTEEIFDIAAKKEYDSTELTKSEEEKIQTSEEEKIAKEKETQEKELAALKSLETIQNNSSPIYTTMAQLRRASILAKRGEQQQALEIYENVIENDADENFRIIAQLRSAFLLVDNAELEDVEKRTEPLLNEENEFAPLAREALALAHYKAANIKKSAELFYEINEDSQAPRGLKRRAEQMLELFAAQGVLAPQQEEINESQEAETEPDSTNEN